GDDLAIPEGLTTYPTVTAAAAARTITIASGGSLVIGSSGVLTLANNTGIRNSGTLRVSGTGRLLGNRNLVNDSGGWISFEGTDSSTIAAFTNNSAASGPGGV